MPPSPPTWEVDGRDEFHRDYNDPRIGPLFQAGFKNQHAKVVKLAVGLSAAQRLGNVGNVIAKGVSQASYPAYEGRSTCGSGEAVR